jgi:hypothetical protein
MPASSARRRTMLGLAGAATPVSIPDARMMLATNNA